MPLLFLQIWFSQRRKFYDLKLKKKNEWYAVYTCTLMILILSSSQKFFVRLAYTDIKFISIELTTEIVKIWKT